MGLFPLTKVTGSKYIQNYVGLKLNVPIFSGCLIVKTMKHLTRLQIQAKVMGNMRRWNQ